MFFFKSILLTEILYIIYSKLNVYFRDRDIAIICLKEVTICVCVFFCHIHHELT